MPIGLLMLGGGAVAGAFGSLLGLGGGLLLVPMLTLGFGLSLPEAVGVSLVSVIMTSSAAAGVYLERHVANLRLGMTLELFTAIGALAGGSIAFVLDERLLSALFAGAARVRGVHHGPRPGRAARARDDRRRATSPTGRRPHAAGSDDPRPAVRRGLPGAQPGPRDRRLDRAPAWRPRCSGSAAGSSRSR